MGFDGIIEKIAALGIPGLILVFLVSSSGFAGAAALTSSLALLGGPVGMGGGIITLGVMVLISQALTTYGLEKVSEAVVLKLLRDGRAEKELLHGIAKYPISKKLKRKLREVIEASEQAQI